jgi:hypothetical protein
MATSDQEDGAPKVLSLGKLPHADAGFRVATGDRAIVIKRSLLSDDKKVTLKFAADDISLPGALDSYHAVIETGSPPQVAVWEYLSGWFANAECRNRWNDVTDSERHLAATVTRDGRNLAITLTANDIAGLNPDAIYYVEERFDVRLERDSKPLPAWVEGWDFDWAKEKDRRDPRPAKSPFDIALGVNLLSRLFQSTRESVNDEPRPVTLRYAVKLEE